MAKRWSEVAASDEFKALAPEAQDGARRQYFDDVVAPQVPGEHRDSAWEQFDADTGGRRTLPVGVAPSKAQGGRGFVNPPAAGQGVTGPSRAQRIAEMDDATNPDSVNSLPVTDKTVSALQTDARGGMDAKRTKSAGRVLDADIESPTATGVLRDLASGALQIPGVMVKGAADIGRLVSGDRIGKDLGEGAESVNKAIRENVGSWRAQQQKQRFQQDMADPNLSAADVVVGNPGALADEILPTVGSMVVPVGAAAVAGKLATGGRAAQLAAAIDPATVAARANAAREAAAIGATVAQNAGDTYSTIRDAGGDQDAAYLGAAITAPATYVAGRLTGGGAEASAAKLLAGSAKGAVKEIPKAMLREGVQEMGEEAGQYTGETVGTGSEFDGNQAGKRLAVAGTLGAVMGGGVEGAGAAREFRIKALRDAGETDAADQMQQKHDIDSEIQRLPGNDEFAQVYREMRTTGVKPAEAAARSAVAVTFKGTAVGLPEKALSAAMAKAKDMPLDEVPGFLQRFTTSLAKRGLVQPFEGMDQLGAQLEAARDDAMDTTLGAIYQPVKPAMDSIEELEQKQPLAPVESTQPAIETVAPASPVDAVDFAAHDAATSPLNDLPEPTQAQKEAGNYKVGRVNLHGLNISIENPEGSVRRGVGDDGKPWENELRAHYGYIRGTEGNDGDHVDAFVGPNPESQKVFVVDQVNKDGSFDEHKVMLGVDNLQQADDLYHANYHAGWTGRGAITEMPIDQFKKWVKDGIKTKPVGQITTPDAGAAPADAADAVQPTASGDAAAPANPVYLGRDNIAIGEGGKAFKTRKAADDARKLNPMMRVVRADGGYALTEKTPAQLAAQEAAAKRLRQPRTSPRGEPIPAHAMIAAEGGLHPDTRADMGMQGNVTIGNRKLFAGEGRGLTIERATEKLVEQGYLPEGASHDQARNLIKRSLTNPQYTPEGTEQMAAAELEARRVAAIAEIEEASDNQFFEIDDADIPWGADVSNTSTEAAMRALGFTDQEISDAIANESRVQGQDSPDSGGPDEGTATPAQTDLGRRESPQGADPGGRSEARREEPRVEPPQTPAPAGVSVSAFESSLRPDGTLAVKGDPAAILEALKDIPRRSLTPMRGGILVGRTQAEKAMAILQPADLTAPTREEVVEQQDRAEQAAKDKEAADRKADKQAREEEDRKRIAKASEAAADSFELGGDAMANLTGQKDIFAEEPVAKQDPVKIEDAGEKIGGARKDKWKDRGLDLTDLDGMSESEGAELATKANVWKPDYEAMAEASEPVTAAMVKTVYDQLAAQPKKNTPEGRRNYVTMMQAVRKAYSEAKSPEDVKQAGDKLKRAIGLYTDNPEQKKQAREVLFSVYKGRSDPFVLGYNELSKAKKMVEDGFPAKGEPWKKRLSLRAYSTNGFTPRGIELTLKESAELGTPLTTDQIVSGFYRINTKDGKAVGYAVTRADAEAAAKAIYERDLKKGAGEKAEPSRPNLDALKRENLPKRTDRDVSADDFVKDFGFRGVEFGNWAAQDERQRIVNMAYDGLMDLAEIMGVPPKALSLNGTMGMAFGARGGGKFAAHYEPGKLVINMTKINGGGSMAHEWAHALDHYFGELNQKDAYTTKARGASGWYDEQQYKGVPTTRMEKDAEGKWANVTKLRLNNLRPEMAKAFDGVMSALFSGQETKAQMVRSEELAIERYEALAAKETDPEMKAVYQRGIESRKQSLEELRKDPEDKTYPKGRSAYASEAQKLVGKSATGYWTRPTEMFARAFESWVFDKVTAMGAKSDYLVHGVEEDRFAGGNYKGNPYPTGQERATINAAFDKLADTIETRETDKGVAMFARGALDDAFRRTIAPRSFMPMTEVQKAIDQLTAKWKDGPTVKVVRTPADLPIVSPADVRGLIHKGVAYIVAANHRDRRAVALTLGHEAIGHYGLWKMLGADGTRQFQRQLQQAIKSGNAPLNKIAQQVRELYKNSDGKFNLSPEQEANEIAAFAVEEAIDADGNFKPGYGFFKELWAKVAQFLRDLGINVKFTNSELQGMLVAAMRGLETGKRLDGGAQGLVAAARDGQAETDVSDPKTGISKALLELGQNDDLYQYPRSDSLELEHIAEDKATPDRGAIKVSDVDKASDNNKLWMLANTTPDDNPAKGVKSWILTMPSGKLATLTKKGNEVYINVSGVGEGMGGSAVYDLAANYALNNGLVFIGDPNGVSPAAMRRRLENMLSSAVKYGTTDHLKPHPDQYLGNEAIGVPPLDWTNGDTLSNIRHMVDVSIASTEYLNPKASKDVRFDAATQSFRDGRDSRVGHEQLSSVLAEDGRASGAGQGGVSTLQRTALFKSLLQSEGARRAFLVGLRRQQDSGSETPSGELKGSFYARGDRDGGSLDRTDTPAFKKWFGDSKVVDSDGKPMVMYHGTSQSQNGEAFDSFDTYASNYGLMGQGGYFTADPEVASSYTSKGKGSTPTVYPAYLSIKNPIDMDAKADSAAWQKQFDGIEDYHEEGDTNEAWYRAAEDMITDQEVPKWEGAEMMQDGLRSMGFDGITHMGGGRVQKDGVKHRVYVAFDPEQIKSATGNRGTYDPQDPNIAFARGGPGLFPPTVWNTPDPTQTDRIIYELQDGRVDLKRVQEAITKSGQQIEEKWDARLAETLYPGRVAYRSQRFLETEAHPLLKAMAVHKVPMDELADYLHARGAEERNAQIAKVNPSLPDGGAGKNSKGVLLTNQAARDYLANISPTRKQVLDVLAAKVDAITAGTRKLLVAEGLEKQETIDAWTSTYKNYVPMFRDEAQSGAPHPQGSGFSVKGSASKRATGSTKEVTNILAHVLMQREAAITRAEKNRVAVALYGQALSHPNPEFWTTIKPNMTHAQIGAELQAMGVDPATAAVGMERAPTITTVDPVSGKKVDRPNPLYKSLPGAIPLKVNAEDRVLMINTETERGARMAENLKNLDGLTKLDLAGSIIGKATRWLASVNTQYNPAFGLVNVTRDTLGGAINLGSTELRGKSLKVLGDTLPAMQGIARELATGKGGKWGDLYRQFQADGGQTGFKELFRDANERAKAVEKELKAAHSAGKLTPGNAAHAVLDLLDGFNTTMENAVRLSAYSTALDEGMSRAHAARLARELTVDFNRKGRMGRELGPLYAFFNASVQGTARTMQAIKGPTGAKIIAGGLALGVTQALMLMAAGYDDDDVPEFVKSRALVIPLNWSGKGEKSHVLIPYPLGLHVIPNTSRIVTELALNGAKDVGKRSVAAIGEIAGAFNPMGGGNVFTMDGLLKTAAPTVVDPLIELGFNRNFAGNTIERPPLKGETDTRPGVARAKEATQRSTTGQAYMGISKALNTLTGGTDYEAGKVSPTPEVVRYLAQTVGGGVLREIEKTINASTAASYGKDVKPSSIPVVGRFYGEVDASQVKTSRYFENANKLDKLETTAKTMTKAGDTQALEKLYAENPEIALVKLGNKVQSAVAKLNKSAVQSVNDPEAGRALDQDRVELMDVLNQAVEQLEKETRPPTPAAKIKAWRKEAVTP